jgi:hypothetical protein
MNVKQQLLRREWSEQRREKERSTTKNIIFDTGYQLEFFRHSISVSGCFPVLSFAGPYLVGPLPKIWTPSLEFTVPKEMIM